MIVIADECLVKDSVCCSMQCGAAELTAGTDPACVSPVAKSLLAGCQLSQFCGNKKPAPSSQLASHSTPRPRLHAWLER